MRAGIAVHPNIHFGKPCVAGTRITVQSVLELVRDGLTSTEILTDYYPDLSQEDVRACIQYAIDVIASEEIQLSEIEPLATAHQELECLDILRPRAGGPASR